MAQRLVTLKQICTCKISNVNAKAQTKRKVKFFFPDWKVSIAEIENWFSNYEKTWFEMPISTLDQECRKNK